MKSGSLHRTTISTVHPGWLSKPRSGSEMLALKLNVSLREIIDNFSRAVDSIVSHIQESKAQIEKQNYLQSLDVRDQKELEKFRTPLVEMRKGASEGVYVASQDHVFLFVVQRSLGYEDYLDWFETDDWGSDARCGLILDVDPEDMRL